MVTFFMRVGNLLNIFALLIIGKRMKLKIKRHTYNAETILAFDLFALVMIVFIIPQTKDNTLRFMLVVLMNMFATFMPNQKYQVPIKIISLVAIILVLILGYGFDYYTIK